MEEGGRPWWKSSAMECRPSTPNARSSGGTNEFIHPTIPATPPKPINLSIVKQEASDCRPRRPIFSPGSRCPPYSPNGKPVDFSRVKLEPVASIKSEPLAYLERALVKGEFPSDLNWPVMKWEPVDGVPGVATASIKEENKHYFPKIKQSVLLRLGNKVPRDRNRPPPNWRYIYSRQSYEPTASARAWWNEDVERVLKKRRDAYLLTKLRDHAPVEVRMERLWSFEVAKDEARRVIAESKWNAGVDLGYSDGVNVGASCSSQPNPYLNNNNNNLSTNADLPLNMRLGQLASVGGDFGANRNEKSPRKDDMSSVTSDEVQILAKDKENIEVLTIDDEIEDALSNSEDEDDVKIISENDSDVIFIQKKQGEVTIIAQIEGKMVRMNRKRKLCVTFQNNAKRKRATAVDTELNNTCATESQEGNISSTEETVSNLIIESSLSDNNANSSSILFDLETVPNFEGEMEDDYNDPENCGQDAVIDDIIVEDSNIDAVATIDDDGKDRNIDTVVTRDENGMETTDENGITTRHEDGISTRHEDGNATRHEDGIATRQEDGIATTIEDGIAIIDEDENQTEEEVCEVLEDQPDNEIALIGEYKTLNASVYPVTENEEDNDIFIDDGSEDEVLVLDSDDQMGKKTALVEVVDEIVLADSSTCSDDDSSIQEAAVDNIDRGEIALNVKSEVNISQNVTVELVETDIEDKGSIVQEKAQDEQNESGFSEEMGTKSEQDSKAEALVSDDFLEKSLVSSQDSLCVETKKAKESGDDEEIKILVNDHIKDEKSDCSHLAAGTSSKKKFVMKIPRRLTRQSILATERSCLDNQVSEKRSQSLIPARKNVSVDSPRTRSRRRLENDTKS